MYTARITGVIWSTCKVDGLKGLKLFLVRKMDGISGKLSGKPVMAVADKVDAGIGDVVLVLDEGGSARSILQNDDVPVRTIIVGIVDQVSMNGERAYYT